jgi:vesicle coat complex subunit
MELQITYLLKNMSKDIKTVSVSKAKKVTIEGQNRKGKHRKQTFTYKEISKNTYEIPAGRGIQVTASDAKHLKLDMPMQNGKKLHLFYSL